MASVSAIPVRLLLTGGPFSARLGASRVLEAIAAGLRAGGHTEIELCPIERAPEQAVDVGELLDGVRLDERMAGARAVIVADRHLRERTLAGSVTFEIATRARQGGVPAYAVTGRNELNAFDARMLDLQVVLQASGASALTAAGRRLARVV